MRQIKWVLKRVEFSDEIVLSGQEEYSFGRGKGNDYTILSLFVSRKHCILRETENGLTVRDLNSSNGTYLNEVRISANEDVTIRTNDMIGFGVNTVNGPEYYAYVIKEVLLIEDDCDAICLIPKNEFTEKKDKSLYAEKTVYVPEDDEEGDVVLIENKNIDIIDVSDDENQAKINVVAKLPHGVTTCSTLPTQCKHSASSQEKQNRATFPVVLEKNTSTVHVKKEKCNPDINVTKGNGTSPKTTCEKVSVLKDEASTKENPSSVIHPLSRNNDLEARTVTKMKIEPGQSSSSFQEKCIVETVVKTVGENCQSVVKKEKPWTSLHMHKDNADKNSCSSSQNGMALNNTSNSRIGLNVTTNLIVKKEKDIDDNDSTESRRNTKLHESYVKQRKDVSICKDKEGSNYAAALKCSKDKSDVNIREIVLQDCCNEERIKNKNENTKEKHNINAQNKNTPTSLLSEADSEKVTLKRSREDDSHSLSSHVNIHKTQEPLKKRKKLNLFVIDDSSTSSCSSQSSTKNKRSSSCSAFQSNVEEENPDRWFAKCSTPFLDKIDETASVQESANSSSLGNNSKRKLSGNNSVIRCDSTIDIDRQIIDKFILKQNIYGGKYNTLLPHHLNPVVHVKKLNLDRIHINTVNNNLKSETEESDRDLFEEAMEVLTSTPVQSALCPDNFDTKNHSRNSSINNYSQSDDVIVIDDDDDDDIPERGMKNEAYKQKCENEEIYVKQEIFDDEDGQDDEDDEEVELVSEWVHKLSQSSSPVINKVDKGPCETSNKKKILDFNSSSSDEDISSHSRNRMPISDHINKITRSICDENDKEIFPRKEPLPPKNGGRTSACEGDDADDNCKVFKSKKTLDLEEKELESDEGELDESQVSINTYAHTLLDKALDDKKVSKPQKGASSYSEDGVNLVDCKKGSSENAKASSNQTSSRRTLLCSALPMKSRSRSKSIENTDQNKRRKTEIEFGITMPSISKENHILNATVDERSSSEKKSKERLSSSEKKSKERLSSSEKKSKERLMKRSDDKSISERELRNKVKEDRKAKLKALAEQRAETTKSQRETKIPSKSSCLVKNTTTSRADKLAESFVRIHSSKNKSSRREKDKILKKMKSTDDIPGTSSKLPPACNSHSVNNHLPDVSSSTTPTAVISDATNRRSDQNSSVSEIAYQARKLSFKDLPKIPKRKSSGFSEPSTSATESLVSARNSEPSTSATESFVSARNFDLGNKIVANPAKAKQEKPLRSSLRKITEKYIKKHVRFPSNESLCSIQMFDIEEGNSLRPVDGKDAPVRKLLALQAEKLYVTSRTVFNRVITAIIKCWNPRWLVEEKVIARRGGDPPPAHCQNTPVKLVLPMLTSFSNFEEYKKIVDPLMMLDLWARVSEDADKPNQRTTEKFNILVDEVKEDKGIITVKCSLPISAKQDKNGVYPHVGDLCILRYPTWTPNDSNHSVTESQQEKYIERFAYIELLTRDYFRSGSNSNWGQGNFKNGSTLPNCILRFTMRVKGDANQMLVGPTLRVISSIRSELRMFEAVGYLEHTRLCKMILNPRVLDYRLPCVDINAKLASEDSLNRAQKTAVIQCASVCVNDKPQVCLIQGPPGTGKTRVIINIIKEILYPDGEYSKLRLDKKIRILLCAPSNAAADELAERLLHLRAEMQKEHRFKMVRTGPMDMLRESVRGVSLDELAKKDVDSTLSNLMDLESVEVEISTLEDRKASFLMSYQNAVAKNESTAMHEKRIKDTENRLADLRLPKNDALDANSQAGGGQTVTVSQGTTSHESRRGSGLTVRRFEANSNEAILNKRNVCSQKTSEMEREARKKVLSHADIVVSTLGSSFNSQMTEVFASRSGRGHHKFTCCIIDEATQCKEPEALVPLMYGIEKIVLVGDPEQLPATVLSQVAKGKSFAQSLFNRIWNKFQNESNNPVIFLNTQYRMHPEIYRWPNKYIYQGKIRSDHSVNFRCPLKPYCLFAHQFVQDGAYFINSNEGMLVSDIAKTLAHSFSDYIKTIGIITPYQRQLKEIKSLIAGSQVNSVTIVANTIDGFQGRECDVIIFSCVRTRGIGFMGESQRLNVALTRARRCLIICGNYVSLQEDKMWSSLLGDAMQRRLIVDTFSKKMTHNEITNCLLKDS